MPYVPKFPVTIPPVKVFHRGGSLFFSGSVVCNYRSLTGECRTVVECSDGLTYVVCEDVLERLSYPVEDKKITIISSKY